MRTTDFSRILFDSLQYSGNDRHNITDETFAQFRDFASARLPEAWESNQWADICRLTTFNTSIDANNVTYFTPVEEADEILGVYARNPQETTKAIPLGYQIYDTGSVRKIVVDSNLSTGWYLYRKDCPTFNGDIYNSSVVYHNGVQIYFDSGSSTGTYSPVQGKPHFANFYTCISSSPTTAGQNPTTNPELWSKIEIPYIFGSFLSWSSAANWLVSEGQMEEAAVIEGKAKEILELEYDKFLRQQGQFGKINMIKTY